MPSNMLHAEKQFHFKPKSIGIVEIGNNFILLNTLVINWRPNFKTMFFPLVSCKRKHL